MLELSFLEVFALFDYITLKIVSSETKRQNSMKVDMIVLKGIIYKVTIWIFDP